MAEELMEKYVSVHYYQPRDYHVFSVERNNDELTNEELEEIVAHLKQEHADKRIALKVTDTSITRIPNLDGLDIVSLAIGNNNLVEVDPSVSNLQNLEYLYVSGNPELSFLPDGIMDLPRLVEFYAEETNIPENIIDQILERAYENDEQLAQNDVVNDIVGGKRKKRRQTKRLRKRGGRMSRRNSRGSRRRRKSSRRSNKSSRRRRH
jgi:hypothetical protein